MEAAEAEATRQGAAFYLTHAYVHALEANDPRAAALKQRLIALGAEVEADDAPPLGARLTLGPNLLAAPQQAQARQQ